MSDYVYVLTSIEMGWDCVCGVYTNYDDAVRYCMHGEDIPLAEMAEKIEDGDTSYVIHTKRLNA
jgi:hypothetical protein